MSKITKGINVRYVSYEETFNAKLKKLDDQKRKIADFKSHGRSAKKEENLEG